MHLYRNVCKVHNISRGISSDGTLWPTLNSLDILPLHDIFYDKRNNNKAQTSLHKTLILSYETSTNLDEIT